MNKLSVILVLIIAIAFASCENSEKGISTEIVNNSSSAVKTSESGTAPKMLFEESVHDFGTLIQGERVSFGFKFTNIGGSDLVITRVSTSCGCTLGNYPEEPIPPGKTGVIEVLFDSKNRKGFQNKTATVLANTIPNTTTLRIKAKITTPERN